MEAMCDHKASSSKLAYKACISIAMRMLLLLGLAFRCCQVVHKYMVRLPMVDMAAIVLHDIGGGNALSSRRRLRISAARNWKWQILTSFFSSSRKNLAS